MRESENNRARDIALRHFLGLLTWLRTVVVQDAAVLYTRHPSAPIFQFPPFNSTTFREFAASSSGIIEKAEKDVALALQNLPKHIAQTFTAAMSRAAIEQERERAAARVYQVAITDQLAMLHGLVEDIAAGSSKKRRTVARTSK